MAEIVDGEVLHGYALLLQALVQPRPALPEDAPGTQHDVVAGQVVRLQENGVAKTAHLGLIKQCSVLSRKLVGF